MKYDADDRENLSAGSSPDSLENNILFMSIRLLYYSANIKSNIDLWIFIKYNKWQI